MKLLVRLICSPLSHKTFWFLSTTVWFILHLKFAYSAIRLVLLFLQLRAVVEGWEN